MKRIICAFFCLFVGSANAGMINDFTGGYDVSNWSTSLDGGSIDVSGAPTSVALTSSNAFPCCGGPTSNTDLTIAALGDGMVSFDWDYTTTDFPSAFDPFGWLLNGVFTQLTDNSLGAQSGTASFAVVTGDIFGFRAVSSDSCCGPATTVISNFAAPVPEPASLILLGLGLAGVGISRRRKTS